MGSINSSIFFCDSKPPYIIFHFIFSEFSALNIQTEIIEIFIRNNHFDCVLWQFHFSGDWNFHRRKLKHSVKHSNEIFKNGVLCAIYNFFIVLFVCDDFRIQSFLIVTVYKRVLYQLISETVKNKYTITLCNVIITKITRFDGA